MTPTGTSQGVTILDDSRWQMFFQQRGTQNYESSTKNLWLDGKILEDSEGRGRKAGFVGNKNARVTEVMMSLLVC